MKELKTGKKKTLKTLKFGGVTASVDKGVAKLSMADTEKLFAANEPGYKKGMFATVKKAIANTVEAIYPEVATQMLDSGLDTDVSVVFGSGGLSPSMVITRLNSGTITSKGEKVPYAKYAGVITKFKSLKPTSAMKEDAIEKMAKKFKAKLK